MNKKVLFIYERKLSELPPLLTLIQLLKLKDYSVTVTVSEIENQYMEEGVKQVEYLRRFKSNNKITRLINRKIVGKNFFKSSIPVLIEKESYDLIWVIVQHSPDNLFSLKKNFNNGKKYYCTIYELFDTLPQTLERIKPIAQRAHKVIVPEFNRAHILRSYFNLDKTPKVIPNKPIDLPKLRDLDVLKLLAKFEGKKIILYQGHISRVRNVESICKAVEKLNNFVFVMMGKSNDGYANELINKYTNVEHIDFIAPPRHLEFTSKAYIGIVAYSHISLNGIFCAPNKIWEYSGYGVPMICNDIPGLVYSVEQNKCGLCIDFNEETSVLNAIEVIEQDYRFYSENAKKMFNSSNLSDIVDEIIG